MTSSSTAVRVAGRVGMVARALLYFVVGLLAIDVARGKGGERADTRGALEAVGRQPLGRFLLVLFAVGLAGYAGWRFAQAVRADSWAKRAAAVGKGLLYVALFWFAVRLVVGRPSGSSDKEADVTARVMRHAWGRPVVFVAGLVIIGGGIGNLVAAVSGRWKKKLRTSEMSEGTERAVTAVAVTGLSARAVVFALIGFFVTRASLRYNPGDATGVDGALKRLAARSYGPELLALVGLGLFAYGLYCLVIARYRKDLEDDR